MKQITPCLHPKWKFKQIAGGMKRECKICGHSIVEAPQGLFGNPVKPNKKSYQRKKPRVND